MAQQDFLDGGYIGKLGATVGQRWKNKRTIRRYVKPANPRTEKQQAGRKLFATACRLAQEALRVNGHDGRWYTTKTPEFSLRLGQALRALRQGRSEADALPLYPEGYTPEITLPYRSVSLTSDGVITATVDVSKLTEPRVFNLSASTISPAEFAIIYKETPVTLAPTAGTFTFKTTLYCAGYNRLTLLGASSDDTAHDKSAIKLEPWSGFRGTLGESTVWLKITSVQRTAANAARLYFSGWPEKITKAQEFNVTVYYAYTTEPEVNTNSLGVRINPADGYFEFTCWHTALGAFPLVLEAFVAVKPSGLGQYIGVERMLIPPL